MRKNGRDNVQYGLNHRKNNQTNLSCALKKVNWVNLSETTFIFVSASNHISQPQTTVTYKINGAL